MEFNTSSTGNQICEMLADLRAAAAAEDRDVVQVHLRCYSVRNTSPVR